MLPGGTTNSLPVGGWPRPAAITTLGACGPISVPECSSAVPLPSSLARWACVSPGRCVSWDAPRYKQTLKSVFPTQFEPGSLADRLLIQGREEGKLAGKIQTFQELLLGEPVSTDDE